MTTDVVYCPECGRCYQSASPSMKLGCGHKVGRPNRVRVRTQRINGYERVLLRRGDARISFLVRPGGSVEWRNRIYSAKAWAEKLIRYHPLYPAAFRARLDIDSRRIPEDLV